ncbi:helix-turn-helix transcriptional regulator [Aquabacterium sp. J223]|uniref:helix-turn-helix transcriptional regulator n=1 Tax=Aquabacterium sp. J223 TaxID=2898431 RepID=UPI0021AD919E|nr:AraC family transcriptional regulator [Aquabacterium sp. J223]UUX94041.1 AraC family transcriptional regulator [Aquabacterium sp. J223]
MALSSQARNIERREGVGMVARILLAAEVGRVHLTIDQPVFILVEHGTKTLRCGHREWHVRAGEAIAVAAGLKVEIVNRMGSDGRYEAWWLCCDASLLEGSAPVLRTGEPVVDAWPMRPLSSEALEAFARARSAVSAPERVPLSVARQRVAEMLVWLGEHGAHFVDAEPATLSRQLRRLLTTSPGTTWSADVVGRHLAMSEATLRRRLAAEGTSLTELLVDVRMSYALTLLQATDRSVATIANDAGYESASRFALRFRQRFGFAPTEVRGHRRAVPRTAN